MEKLNNLLEKIANPLVVCGLDNKAWSRNIILSSWVWKIALGCLRLACL